MSEPYDVVVLGGGSGGEAVARGLAGLHAEQGLAACSRRREAKVGIDVPADLVHAFPTYAEALEPAYAELAHRLSGEDR